MALSQNSLMVPKFGIVKSIFYRAPPYRFTTYQDARRDRLFETNILRVSPVKHLLVVVSHIKKNYFNGALSHSVTELLNLRLTDVTRLNFFEV